MVPVSVRTRRRGRHVPEPVSRRCSPTWPPTSRIPSSGCALVQQSMTAAKEQLRRHPGRDAAGLHAVRAAGHRGPGHADVQPAAHRRPDEPAVQPHHLERARARPTRSTRPAPGSSTSTRSRRIADGQGLNMTVQSYNGNLDFGFIACRELVPDLWSLIDYLHESMQELLDSIATSTPAPKRPPPKASDKKATAKRPAKKARPRPSGRRRRPRPASGHPSSGRRLGRQPFEVGGVVVADELPAPRAHPPQLGQRRVDRPQLEPAAHRQVRGGTGTPRRSPRRGRRRRRSSRRGRRRGRGRPGRRGGGTRPGSRRRGSVTANGSLSQSGMPWRSRKSSKVRPSHSGPGSCSPTAGSTTIGRSPQRRRDELRGLDGPREVAGDEHVGLDLARAGQPVGQGLGLLAPERREAAAGPVAADGAGHGGVRLAVADEDEAGHRQRASRRTTRAGAGCGTRTRRRCACRTRRRSSRPCSSS